MDELVLDKTNTVLLALRNAAVHENIIFPAMPMEIARKHDVWIALL